MSSTPTAIGNRARGIALPSEATWQIRETRDGKLVVPAHLTGLHWDTLLIDPMSGAMQRIPGVALENESGIRKDPRRPLVDPPKFFFQNGRVMRWNYATQRSEVVVPKG